MEWVLEILIAKFKLSIIKPALAKRFESPVMDQLK